MTQLKHIAAALLLLLAATDGMAQKQYSAQDYRVANYSKKSSAGSYGRAEMEFKGWPVKLGDYDLTGLHRYLAEYIAGDDYTGNAETPLTAMATVLKPITEMWNLVGCTIEHKRMIAHRVVVYESTAGTYNGHVYTRYINYDLEQQKDMKASDVFRNMNDKGLIRAVYNHAEYDSSWEGAEEYTFDDSGTPYWKEDKNEDQVVNSAAENEYWVADVELRKDAIALHFSGDMFGTFLGHMGHEVLTISLVNSPNTNYHYFAPYLSDYVKQLYGL